MAKVDEDEDEDEGEDEEGADVAAAESVYSARMAAGAYTMQLLDMAAAYLVSRGLVEGTVTNYLVEITTPHATSCTTSLQVSAKQKALRQKTLRTLYDTNHSLHDVWAGVQECR